MVAGTASAIERGPSASSGPLSPPQSGAKTGGTAVTGLETVGGLTQVQTAPKKGSASTETTSVKASRRREQPGRADAPAPRRESPRPDKR
jgi:hypothetical protein